MSTPTIAPNEPDMRPRRLPSGPVGLAAVGLGAGVVLFLAAVALSELTRSASSAAVWAGVIGTVVLIAAAVAIGARSRALGLGAAVGIGVLIVVGVVLTGGVPVSPGGTSTLGPVRYLLEVGAANLVVAASFAACVTSSVVPRRPRD